MLHADACYGGIPISSITHGKHSYTPIGDIGTTLGRHSFHPWMFFLTPLATICTTLGSHRNNPWKPFRHEKR